MGETEEFAEALMDQIGVELAEEREIAGLAERIAGDPSFKAEFEPLEALAERAAGSYGAEISALTGLDVPPPRMEFPELAELKKLKGRKVHAAGGSQGFVTSLFAAVAAGDTAALAGLAGEDTQRFLAYSTYAKSYISRITTTYGDYLDGTIYLNRFVLSRYPQIVLYKRGEPYEAGMAEVASAYAGAVKMTVMEEMVHSTQGPLHEANREAVAQVNSINEELAGIMLGLDDGAAGSLTEYLRLQPVPDGFPIARRANLFFALNPDNFVMGVLGPDVLTYDRVEVDPRIAELVPGLHDMYQRWLGPIQRHEAAFAAMEGMAGFCVDRLLQDDADFGQYLSTFMGTDRSAYAVRKGMGRQLVSAMHEKMGSGAFGAIISDPPTTKDLKDPAAYVARH